MVVKNDPIHRSNRVYAHIVDGDRDKWPKRASLKNGNGDPIDDRIELHHHD